MHMNGTQLPSIMDKCQESEEGASAGFPEEVKTHEAIEINPHRCKFKKKGMKRPISTLMTSRKKRGHMIAEGVWGLQLMLFLRFTLASAYQISYLNFLFIYLLVT